MQGKEENGKVYSPVLTGNVFSDTGFHSTATGKYHSFLFKLNSKILKC